MMPGYRPLKHNLQLLLRNVSIFVSISFPKLVQVLLKFITALWTLPNFCIGNNIIFIFIKILEHRCQDWVNFFRRKMFWFFLFCVSVTVTVGSRSGDVYKRQVLDFFCSHIFMPCLMHRLVSNSWAYWY